MILHSGGIGDLLLALPAMRSFRQKFSSFSLELMGRPERLSLVAFDLKVQTIHSSDRAGMAYFYLENEPLPQGLAPFFAGFKAILVFGKSKLDLLSLNLKRAGPGQVISVPSFPADELKIPVSDYLVGNLQRKGFKGENLFAPISLPEETLAWASSFWRENEIKIGERVLAIHPGSGSPKKNWAFQSFVEVAEWARGRFRALWIRGPAEGEDEGMKKAFETFQPLLADQLPLLRLAGLLKGCSAYLGNDSGITHLASSLGVPSVALFGSTDPVVWGPKGPAVKIVYDPGGLDRIDPGRAIEALSSFPIREDPRSCSQSMQGE